MLPAAWQAAVPRPCALRQERLGCLCNPCALCTLHFTGRKAGRLRAVLAHLQLQGALSMECPQRTGDSQGKMAKLPFSFRSPWAFHTWLPPPAALCPLGDVLTAALLSQGHLLLTGAQGACWPPTCTPMAKFPGAAGCGGPARACSRVSALPDGGPAAGCSLPVARLRYPASSHTGNMSRKL